MSKVLSRMRQAPDHSVIGYPVICLDFGLAGVTQLKRRQRIPSAILVSGFGHLFKGAAPMG